VITNSLFPTSDDPQNLTSQNSKPIDHFAWVRTESGKLLHCVPDVIDDQGMWHDSFLEDGGMNSTAACGRSYRFWAPGVFSRMYAERCPSCCDALNLPRGSGTPRNEKG
jgi:hypothetical protein